MTSGMLQNILDPAILFFVFGVLAGFVRSNLEVPPAIVKFASLYLLIALGLKGGASLATGGLPAVGPRRCRHRASAHSWPTAPP